MRTAIMASEYPAFKALSEAIQRAQDIVKGGFHISEEGEEGEISKVKRLCVDTINNHWLVKAKPLGLQIPYLLLGLHKASRYTPE